MKKNSSGNNDIFKQNNNFKQNIGRVITGLEENNFIVQEGEFKYLNILKLCSLGLVDTCMGNNATSAYALCLLPPAPNQNPAKGQKPSVGYNPDNPDNYPANINFIAPGGTFKLRADEAIVIIGQTPPPAVYFSFQSYLFFVENKPDKDYSDYFVIGNEDTGTYHRVFAAMGNATNNYNIWTENTPQGEEGFPYNSSTVIISSADKGVNKEIRESLYTAGYSLDIMNDDIIPMDMTNMGLEKGKDNFLFLMRGAIWAEKYVGDAYIHNFDQFMKVHRVTPKKPVTKLKPWSIPKLKVRETGTTEFQIIPSARDDLDYLRNEIIEKYGSSEYNHIDLDTNLWVLNSYEGILQDVDVLGDGRDATYLKTNNFQLATDDDFVILYGVNHELSGKATYCNCCFYGDEFLNGVAVANVNIEFPYSAEGYFPEDYENARYYYLCKMARKVDEDCLITIPYSTGNLQGKAFGIDNNEDAFIGFRLYLDQEALVGPALFDIIWDRAILFTKKKKS
ncbi:MAG: hypothetical protein ACOCRZ_04260 [Halothermotrichaceae bacterium]